MKVFLTYLVKIIVSIYMVAFALEYLSDRGLSHLKNSVYNDWKNILNGNLNSEVLIMGSSRGFVSYDSPTLSKELKLSTHNLSFDAGSYMLQQDKLDIYLKNNKTPKIIIQNVDFAHFGKNNAIPSENQFLPFINNEDVNAMLLKYDNKFEALHYFPLLKYNLNLNYLRLGIVSNFYQKPIENRSTYNGFCPKKMPFKVDTHNLKRLDDLAKKKSDITAELQEILKFYKSKVDSKTQIIFVWAPEHKLRSQAKYKGINAPIIQELVKIDEQNENIHFINLSNHELLNSNEYFYDTFHLNKNGAKIFSTILSNKINKIIN